MENDSEFEPGGYLPGGLITVVHTGPPMRVYTEREFRERHPDGN